MTGIFKVNLQLEEISTVPSAVSGSVILYADSSSHKLYIRNASGAFLLGSMDNPMTNAGDIIVGGADGVPTRVALGTANHALTVNSGGTGIGYTDGSAIPAVAQNTSAISFLSSGKQDKLTAGTGIDITSNVISATTATVNDFGVVKPDGTTITINNGVISGVPGFENPMTTSGDIIVGASSGTATRMGLGASNYVLGVNSAGTGLEYSDGSNIPALSSKQDTLTAGTGISISSNTISATTATANDLGVVKPDGTTITISDGVLTSTSSGGMANPMTTAGDIIVGVSDGAPTRLGIGTANYSLGVNSAGTALEYSDGANIPQVAQNTDDISVLQYQINMPYNLYLTSTETSTGSGVYEMTVSYPTAISGTSLHQTATTTEAKLFEFSFVFPADGWIHPTNRYSISVPFSGLNPASQYSFRYVLKHVNASTSIATNIATGSVSSFYPLSPDELTIDSDLTNALQAEFQYSKNDTLVLEIYGSATEPLDGFTYSTTINGDIRGNIYYGNNKFWLSYGSGAKYSLDGSSWSSVSFSGVTGYNFYSCVNGVFVCSDSISRICTSPDGINWSLAQSRIYGWSLKSVCYGNGTYVFVGDYGIVITSNDLVTFENAIYLSYNYLRCVCYGNGLFVAVGENGKIFTSPNGTTWTERTTGVSQYLNSVVYGDSGFVAVGGSGTVLTSSDGITWTQQTLPDYSAYILYNVVYFSGTYVVSGQGGLIAYSTDLQNWTFQLPPSTPLRDYQYMGTNGGAIAIATSTLSGSYSTVRMIIASSQDTDCNLVVEKPTNLALIHRDFVTEVDATHVYTTINGTTQTQQVYNESVQTSLSGKQNTLYASTGITISGNYISATTATSSALGIVRPDNSTITVNNGVLSSAPQSSVTFRYWD